MHSHSKVAPPKLAQRFLRWYCKPELAEDLEGDLNEMFTRNVASKGITRAKLIYYVDVLKFLRPYTTRSLNVYNFLFRWIMLGNYIKISGRIVLRNKLFSSINIAGLGVSMAVGLLLIGLFYDMQQYDRFHENYDRIYRVVNKYRFLDHEDHDFYASTSLRTADAIAEAVPEIEGISVLYRGFGGDIRQGDKAVTLSGFWANDAFFKVFSFELEGNPSTALKDPYTVVLTEEASKKLFGDASALGKSIHYPVDSGHLEFIVTGIIKNFPKSSHLQFDILASMASRDITHKEYKNEKGWAHMWDAYVYLLTRKDTDVQQLQSKLDAVAEAENKKIENTTIKLFLQPMSEIALGLDMNNSIGKVLSKQDVKIFSLLTVVVILSACFNYTNLSLARSLRRSKEIGIRKTIGALSHQVAGQFVTEAIIISLVALMLSAFLFVILKPFFLSLNGQYATMLTLEFTPAVILYFIVFALAVGIAAGFFPALFFSKVNAIKVLKNISTSKILQNFTLRQTLIVMQFTISLMFIAVTITGYQHYKSILAFDLGFETENVLNISLQGNKPEAIKKALLELPEFKKVSTSMIVTGVGDYWGTQMKYKDPQDSSPVRFNKVDENYIALHGHNLIAGRNFSAKPAGSTESEVIVNEKVLKRFNIGGQDPQKAIGEVVTVDRKEMQIIGVMKDYQYGRATDQGLSEVVFRYDNEKPNYLNAKVVTSDWPATQAKIEKIWKKFDNVHPLKASFYDDQIEKAYSDYSSKIKLMGSLSILAICIASIGLFGMVVFTTETRLKEISIRKVLGANESTLVYLLSKNFLVLLGIAALVALPVTEFFFAKYALGYYAETAPIPWLQLITGVLCVFGLAFVMVLVNTIHTARTNPATVLKSE